MLNRIAHEVLTLERDDIAQLTNDQINRLNYDEMVDVVLASELPVRNVESIRSFEGDTVCRLVHRAREHCRRTAGHQPAASRQAK